MLNHIPDSQCDCLRTVMVQWCSSKWPQWACSSRWLVCFPAQLSSCERTGVWSCQSWSLGEQIHWAENPVLDKSAGSCDLRVQHPLLFEVRASEQLLKLLVRLVMEHLWGISGWMCPPPAQRPTPNSPSQRLLQSDFHCSTNAFLVQTSV